MQYAQLQLINLARP